MRYWLALAQNLIIIQFGNILNTVDPIGKRHFEQFIFLQSLSKTSNGAVAKIKSLFDIDITENWFNDELKKWTKPTLKMFGVSMTKRTSLKSKKDFWIADTTPEFWEAWRQNKDQLKKEGWTCFKDEDYNWKMLLWSESFGDGFKLTDKDGNDWYQTDNEIIKIIKENQTTKK